MNRASLPGPVADFLRDCGIAEGGDAARLLRFYDDLVTANRRTNLTRITDWEGFCVRHVADSLSVLRALPDLAVPGLRVADVGCGAGFPMIPLLWAVPGLALTGIESRARKVEFVRREIAALGLASGACEHARARELGRRPEWRGTFDVVLLRAVGAAAQNLHECRRLLDRGRIVCYKTPEAVSAEWAEARRAAARHGFELERSAAFDLPDGHGRRQFLLFRRDAGAAPSAT